MEDEIFSAEMARAMRQGLATIRPCRKAANMAVKYIRKGMSLKDGSVVTEGVSLHEMAVWNVPVWAAAPRGRGQPGQEGDVNFGETVAFDWRELVCGLPEASFEFLFSGNKGITGVYLMEVGEIGIHWASQGSRDVDFIFHTRPRKAILHPGLDGGLECRVVDMTADLAPAGPSAEEKAAGRRRGPKRAAGFLHGGAEDKAFLENMVERAAAGGPDERLWRLPMTSWQSAKVTLLTIQ
jgi:hypothetical protein